MRKMLLNQVQNEAHKQDVEVTSAFRSKKKKISEIGGWGDCFELVTELGSVAGL